MRKSENGIFNRLKKSLDDIPNYIINAITIVSFLSPLAVIVIDIIYSLIMPEREISLNFLYAWSVIGLIVILVLKIRKYHNLLQSRMDIVPLNFYRFLNASKGIYFDIMRYHKKKTLNVTLLTELYQKELANILNYLCEVMESYTGRKVSSCIKIINYDNPDNKIDIEKATVTTFCRSHNSIERGDYEKDSDPIFIIKNTDFLEIVDQGLSTSKPYFYVRDLKKYDESLKKTCGRNYQNSNPNYYDSYKGTIVVPIRIESKKLYDVSKKEKYDIIGFLCVDSKSADAFLEKQEVFNTNIVKAFAENIYVLLGQYAHYLRKFSKDS